MCDGGYDVMWMMMVFFGGVLAGVRGILGIKFGIMGMRGTIMGLMARACKMMVG